MSLVEIRQTDHGFSLPKDEEPTHRIDKAVWEDYLRARAAVRALETLIQKNADTPVYVSPEQAVEIRKIAKRGAWIVERAADVVREVTVPRVEQIAVSQETQFAAPANPPVQATTPAPPKFTNPATLGPCEARQGLPHTVVRWVLTDQPGRVDGLCQCGLRIPNVACPHQHQKYLGEKPYCAWCNKPMVGGPAGVLDNRKREGAGGGAVDPNIRTEIPIGAAKGDRFPDAYRVKD